jgi:hypothetical protein
MNSGTESRVEIVNNSRTETPKTRSATFRSLWFNPRRKRFWAIAAITLYALLGFFAAPWLLKKSVIDFVNTDLGRQASIEKVKVNPFTLSLTVTGFEMQDTDSARLAALGQLHVNLQLSSLYRRAWTFREISLDRPYFLFERYTSDESRLSRLLADLPPSEEPEPVTPEQAALPRLLVNVLAISNGNGDLRDNVPVTPVHLALGPINIEIHELNSLPDRTGRQEVSIALPDNASLSWQGSLSLSPLESTGELVLENSHLGQVIAYLEEAYPLDSIEATLSARLNYHLFMEDNGEPRMVVSDLQAELDALRVSGLTPSEEFLEVEKIAIQGGSMRFPEREMMLDRIQIDNPGLLAWLDPQGNPSLNQLNTAPAPANAAASDDDAGWKLMIGELGLSNGRLRLLDHQIDPANQFEINNIDFLLNQFSNVPDANIPFRISGGLVPAGAFELEGSMSYLPELSVAAKASANSIPMSLGQPYLARMFQLQLESGDLNAELELKLEAGSNLLVEGALDMAGLQLKDTRDGSALLGWKMLEIDRFALAPEKSSLHLSQVVIDELYGRLAIKEDRTTNLDGLQTDAGPMEATPVNEEQPFELIIGGTRIRNGSVDFSDFSLPLPFATRISNLDGTLSTIATGSSEPARIQMEGKVDEYGLARINGTINLLQPLIHTDTRVEFSNLQMSNLTPYTVQFAGREIDEGKLNLDLAYVITDGALAGENEVVMSDLVLGKEVESPDAANLPLGLAVALLTDSDGVINVNLPVGGNVNDPEFRIGGVIWKAFTGLITKIISAPFRLLGSLIGVDSDDLGQFQFLAGRSDLTPPELEKVTQLEKALAERPELAVEVSGVFDPVVDTPALKYIQLRNTVIQLLNRDADDNNEDLMMLDDEIRQALETLFAERNPDVSLDSVKALHTTQAADDPEAEPTFDQSAYAGDLRDRLLESEPVTQENLLGLANARAETIRSAFLASGQFAESRVILAESKKIESEDGEWVVTELGVAAE